MCASDDNVTTLEHLSGEPDLMKNVIYSVYKDTRGYKRLQMVTSKKSSAN